MNKTEFSKLLRFSLKVTLFLILTLILSCGSELPTQQVKPTKKAPFASEEPFLSENVDKVIKDTRQVYQWYCTQCHGENGYGDGVNAPYLVVPPRDHTKADYLETRSDQQLFEAIKLGGLSVGRAPCMPAWGYTFNDQTIRSLVSYIRDLCNCKAL